MLFVLSTAVATPDGCAAPCGRATCGATASLLRVPTCASFAALGCDCTGCCVVAPLPPTPPAQCAAACLDSTCGALASTLTCEQTSRLGCDCDGCCSQHSPYTPPPAPLPPTPPFPSPTHRDDSPPHAPLPTPGCSAPCGKSTCAATATLLQISACSEFEALGCDCADCCATTPPSPPPSAQCNAACRASTCGALASTFTCEQTSRLGCDCGGCCAHASPPPASPPALDTLINIAGDIASGKDVRAQSISEAVSALVHEDPRVLVATAIIPVALRFEISPMVWSALASMFAARFGGKPDDDPGTCAHLATAAVLLPSAAASAWMLFREVPPPPPPPPPLAHGPLPPFATPVTSAASPPPPSALSLPAPPPELAPAALVDAGAALAVGVLALVIAGSCLGGSGGRAPGLSARSLDNGKPLPWAKACEKAGVGGLRAALSAFARLCLWHLLQPTVYLIALAVYWPQLGGWSHTLGALVGVREVLYAVTCFVALWTNPSYLLVDVRATLRDEHKYSQDIAIVYVLAPEKFVTLAAFSGLGIANGIGYGLFPASMLLDLCGIAALVVAIVPAAPFPPALLVGYSLTALAAVAIILLLVDGCNLKLSQKAGRALRQELI